MKASSRTPAGQRVWESARELFYRDGIRAVGVAEIADHSGVAKPNIYRNFVSKDGLVLAYLKDQADADRALFTDAAKAAPDDVEGQLRWVVSHAAAIIGTPTYRGCPLANAAVEFPELDHPVHIAVARYKKRYLERLEALTSRMRVRAPARLAYAILMLLEGASSMAQSVDRKQAARTLQESVDALLSEARRSPR